MRQRLLLAFLIPLLAWGLSACDATTDRGRESAWPGSGAPAASIPVETLLVDLFQDADRADHRARWSPDSQDALAFLTSGWHDFEVSETGEPFVWSRGRISVIEVPRTSVGPLRLSLDLGTLVADSLPVQNLKLVWNGHPLGQVSLQRERQHVEVEIPEEVQHRGQNRLELMPRFWVDPRSAGLSDDARQLGVSLFAVELLSERPEHVSARNRPRVESRAIVQPPGNVVTFGLELPSDARFEVSARLAAPNRDGEAPPGEAWINLIDQAGREHTIDATPLGELEMAASFTLDVDLGDFAGQMVNLSFGMSVQREGALAGHGYRMWWEEPRITGTREAVATTVGEIPRDRYNVMLVLFDTLRADDTEPYGSPTVATPTMERLASRGVTFVNSFANSSWTKPSVTSLLTSLYPAGHRVIGAGSVAGPELPRIASALQAGGYTTVAISNNPYLSRRYGLDAGFDEMHEYFETSRAFANANPDPRVRAQHVWDQYIEPTLERSADAPFFIYLHERDPHFPYEAPPEYNERYDFGYRGHFGDAVTVYRDQVQMMRAINGASAPWTNEADIRHLRSRYAAEITAMDDYLAWLLAKLDERGLREDTLIVFLSDHGEAFMEHGVWGHGQTVYDEMLRVPMIFSLPGVLPEARRPEVDAQLVDVGPTVLDLVDLPAPRPSAGASLLPYMTLPDDHRPGRPTFARSNWIKADRAWVDSLRFRGWKLIRRDSESGRVEYALYDVSRDPEEKLDRWAGEPVVGRTLRQMMERQHRLDAQVREAAQEAPLDPEVDAGLIEELRALGYAE